MITYWLFLILLDLKDKIRAKESSVLLLKIFNDHFLNQGESLKVYSSAKNDDILIFYILFYLKDKIRAKKFRSNPKSVFMSSKTQTQLNFGLST